MNNLSDQFNPIFWGCDVFNNNHYIKIKKNFWKNSIDILFDDIDECEYINLYLALKSYTNSNELIVYKIYIIIKNIENDDIVIFKDINLYLIYKMNFIEFYTWYKNTYDWDYEYIKKHEACGLRLVFANNITNNIYPIYPWTDIWKIINNV